MITSGSARVPVEVASEDVGGIRVMVMPEAQVSGRIVVDGEDKPDLSSASLSFVFDGTRSWTVPLNSDLSFNGKVVPGNYHVLVSGLRSSGKVYVKSIMSGVTDVLGEGLTLFPGGRVSLEIVVATGGGTVEGAVVNAGEQPLPGAIVVLAPEPKLRARPGRFRSASADQYGRYALQSIPPGGYTWFAWEDVEPFAWSDPDFLKVYEKRGVPVRIQAKGQAAVKLRVADTPER